jgi:hypothetical protein
LLGGHGIRTGWGETRNFRRPVPGPAPESRRATLRTHSIQNAAHDPNRPDNELITLIDRVGARVADATRQRESEQALRELYDRTSSRLFGLAVRSPATATSPRTCCRKPSSPSGARRRLPRLAQPAAGLAGMIVRSRALDFLRRRTSERADTTQDWTT